MCGVPQEKSANLWASVVHNQLGVGTHKKPSFCQGHHWPGPHFGCVQTR